MSRNVQTSSMRVTSSGVDMTVGVRRTRLDRRQTRIRGPRDTPLGEMAGRRARAPLRGDARARRGADAERTVWAFERALAVARLDPELLRHLLVARRLPRRLRGRDVSARGARRALPSLGQRRRVARPLRAAARVTAFPSSCGRVPHGHERADAARSSRERALGRSNSRTGARVRSGRMDAVRCAGIRRRCDRGARGAGDRTRRTRVLPGLTPGDSGYHRRMATALLFDRDRVDDVGDWTEARSEDQALGDPLDRSRAADRRGLHAAGRPVRPRPGGRRGSPTRPRRAAARGSR